MLQRYAIVLVPDPETQVSLYQTSDRICDNALSLKCAPNGHKPHLPLFHFMGEPQNLPRIVAGLQEKLKTVRYVLGQTTSCYGQTDGWIFLQVQKSSQLSAIQVIVVAAVEPHRVGKVPFTRRMSEKQTESYERWGYPFVGSAWNCQFPVGLTSRCFSGYELEKKWWSDLVALGPVDDNGTITRYHHLFPLAAS